MRSAAGVFAILCALFIAGQASAFPRHDDGRDVRTQASMNDFDWSYSGPLRGYCVNVNEPADPDAWGDNYLCSRRDYGLRFSYAGPIAGMHCVNMNEPEDPDTWADNYICTYQNIGLRWEFAGPRPGWNCLQINEPAEPYEEAWHDNYLCMRR